MTICKAKIIASSFNFQGTNLRTFELEYPRIVHAELLTHRMLSKNSSSSRAIPSATVISQLEENMFVPEYWGKNQSGMQAREQLDQESEELAREIWIECGRSLIEFTKKLQSLNLHKQLSNRVSEAIQMIKVCLSGTEFNNFYHLRDHDAAQPELQALARAMKKAESESKSRFLLRGDWHLPYYQEGHWIENIDGRDVYGFTLEQALKISMSCCAQTSYRKSDDTLEKAENLFKVFFETTHIHASPSEHQGTVMERPTIDWRFTPAHDYLFENGNEGATHIDLNGDVWSGNFKHFIQYRQLISGNNVPG